MASALVVGIQACGGGTFEGTNPSSSSSSSSSSSGATAGEGTNVGNDGTSSSPSKNDPGRDPSAQFKGPTRIQYSQSSFGSAPCNTPTTSVDADLAAKTMTIKQCSSAGGGKDAGTDTDTRLIALTDADIAALTSLVEALREDFRADSKCSGFDGTSHQLVLRVGGRDLDVRHEFICSGPAPDVRIERPGFIALREKLHILAGLNPKMPPW